MDKQEKLAPRQHQCARNLRCKTCDVICCDACDACEGVEEYGNPYRCPNGHSGSMIFSRLMGGQWR